VPGVREHHRAPHPPGARAGTRPEKDVSRPFQPDPALGLEEVDVEQGYALWAPAYDRMLTDTVDGNILRRFLPSLPDRKLRLLDLGCGTGRNVLWLLEHGVRVEATGVDLSGPMLDRARAKGLYRAVHQGDVAEARPPGKPFELALSVLVASHIESLEPLFRSARENLDAEGQFWLVDMHPHLFHLGKGTFLPLEGRTLYIRNHAHEIADYLNAASGAGFALLEAAESFVPTSWGKKSATYRDVIGHPLGIGFRWGCAGTPNPS